MALLIAVAGVAGCGEEKPTKPTVQDRLPVVYERGGGIAAQPTSLRIDTGGHAVLTQRTGPKVTTREFDLSDAQLDELALALEEAAGAKGPGESYCADCFTYTVRARGVSFTLDDSNRGESDERLKALVSVLERLG